jgi:hypothetical protein
VLGVNIRQYYKQYANASLHGSLASLIPAVLLLIYSIFIVQQYQLILLILPFLIYSFFSYQRFLLHYQRAKDVHFSSTLPSEEVNLLNENELMLTFLPSPSLRLLFFHHNGMKAGELRDERALIRSWFIPKFFDRFLMRKYGLYDDRDELIAYYHVVRDKIGVYSLNEGGELVLTESVQLEKHEAVFMNKNLIIKNKGLQDFLFEISGGKKVMSIQTGWMPLEWGERFVDANTPILMMDHHLSRKEKVTLFSLLIQIFAYANH